MIKLNYIGGILLSIFTLGTNFVNSQELPAELITQSYMDLGESNEALSFLNKLENTAPLHQKLLMQKGQALYNESKFKEATNLFLSIYPKTKCNYELARCYAQLNKAEIALDYLSKHMKSKQKKPMFSIKSDAAFNNISSTKSWLTFWKQDWYSKTEMEYMDAAYEYKLGNIKEANRLLEAFTLKRKRYHKAWHLLAKTEYDLNNNKLALKHINTALDLNRKQADYYYTKAQILSRLNKESKAQTSIIKAKNLAPESFNIAKSHILILLKNNNYSAASTEVEQLTKYIESNEVYTLAAEVYMQQGNYLKALSYLNKSIAMDDYNPDLYLKRAKIYEKTQTLTYADKDYSMALDFKPFDADIYFQRGLIRFSNKDAKGACSDFLKARQLGSIAAEKELQVKCNSFTKSK